MDTKFSLSDSDGDSTICNLKSSPGSGHGQTIHIWSADGFSLLLPLASSMQVRMVTKNLGYLGEESSDLQSM